MSFMLTAFNTKASSFYNCSEARLNESTSYFKAAKTSPPLLFFLSESNFNSRSLLLTATNKTFSLFFNLSEAWLNVYSEI